MNFSFESLNFHSNQQNENFYLDVAMPRGHFFAVLDFASHDYTNLNAALRGKLETIIGSFSSLPDFSDDLFLGFVAKEINNFISNLAEQTGDPRLPFGAALSMVSGNRFSYFLAGDVVIKIPGLAELVPSATSARQLGVHRLESPLTDHVQDLTLRNSDVVLMMTKEVAEGFEKSPAPVVGADPKAICDSLMKTSEAAQADRTAVVICGPFETQSEASTDQNVVAELKASLALLESRLEGLRATNSSVQPDLKFERQLQSFKDDLKTKAPAIDLLEIKEKLHGIDALLTSKADNADLMGLQRDVLKLGLSNGAPEKAAEKVASAESDRQSTFPLRAALVIVALALVAGFAAGWLQTRLARKPAEVWSVRTAGNQIVISRIDSGNAEAVAMTVAEPLKSNGEQRFSSFADVKRYVETVSVLAQASETKPQPAESKQTETTTEVTIKPGDSLKKLAELHNVPPEKIMELNPSITKWPSIRIGQKVVVPVVASVATATPAQSAPSPTTNASPAGIAEITVGPGDSLNELARRFNTTAGRLKELNPTFNWPRIQAGQKVIVPAPAGG